MTTEYFLLILMLAILIAWFWTYYVYCQLLKLSDSCRNIYENLDTLYQMTECYICENQDIRITEAEPRELENGTKELRGKIQKK